MSNEIVTTVVTPASTYDLTTLALAKVDLSIPVGDTTQDAFISAGITQVSKAIANECNRVFPVEVVKDIFYMDCVSRRSVLQLSRWPITTVASVTEDSGLTSQAILVANTNYVLRADNGQLLRIDSSNNGLLTTWSSSTVTVQYSAGFATIPDDLAMATLRAVTLRFASRGRDPMLIQRDQPSRGAERFWVGALRQDGGAFTPEIDAILNYYSMPIFA